MEMLTLYRSYQLRWSAFCALQFVCSCIEGYHGNGTYCVANDVCSQENGGCYSTVSNFLFLYEAPLHISWLFVRPSFSAPTSKFLLENEKFKKTRTDVQIACVTLTYQQILRPKGQRSRWQDTRSAYVIRTSVCRPTLACSHMNLRLVWSRLFDCASSIRRITYLRI